MTYKQIIANTILQSRWLWLIVTCISLPFNIYCQESLSEIERLQNIRAVNLQKGQDFKHWVNTIAVDDSGLLWISAHNLLYTYDGTTISERAHVEDYGNFHFERMFEINDTFFFFGKDMPPHYLAYKQREDVIRKANWNISPYSHCVSSDSITLLTTKSGEILKYIGGKFETLFAASKVGNDTLYNASYKSIIIDNNDTDKIWYYHKNHLYHISIAYGSYDTYNCLKEAKIDLNYKNDNGSYAADLTQIGEDIYLGSVFDGLLRFHIPTKKWYQYMKPIPTEYIGKEDHINSVLDIHPYNDSLIILAGNMHAVFNINEKKIFPYKGNNGIYNMYKSGTSLQTEGAIFKCNFHGGITVLTDAANKFDNEKNLKVNNKSNTINSDGTIYTSDKLYIYGVDSESDTIDIINVIKELSEEVTENLTVDKNDCIWIGTSTGIIRYNTQTKTFRKYTRADGLATKDWSKNFSASQIAGNKIMLQSGESTSIFHPDTLMIPETLSLPYVYKFSILDSTVHILPSAEQEISLAPEEDYFTIHYSLRDYQNGSTVKFEYMIESYDNDWLPGGAEHKVSYNHVPPGNYNFLVRASNAEGNVIVTGEPFVIRIKAFWYESLFFKLCLILLAGLILFLFYKMKTASLKRELALRSEFNEELSQVKLEALRSQMNPHFLFNCLNSIDNFILSNDARNASEYLGKFSKLIRNILDYSKTNAITLREELESTELYIKMEQMRFSDKFDYNITVDPSIDQNIKSIPPLILQPYVENSIWHGLLHKKEKGSIHITISQDANFYNIKIDDNGIGRKKAQSIKTKTATKRKSHGMKITEDRIRLVHQLNGQGGTVDTIDKTDSQDNPTGTTVIIQLAIPQL